MHSYNLMRKLTSGQVIILSFLIVILSGSLLLMLPFMSTQDGGVPFQDALFTATSAVCVTGLVVRDTATSWTFFGQFIILLMIQVGGLGVVTITSSFAMLSGRKIGIMQRSTLQNAISAQKVGGVLKLTKFIIKLTLIFESIGFALTAPSFCMHFGFWKGIWYSLFHSVSAFCNAGFDLMGSEGAYGSLTIWATDPVINIVTMLLIIFGGLGFLTWDDIVTQGIKIRRYSMQSKVILTTSLCLIIFPAIYFFFAEFAGKTPGARVLYSLFQSVTTRTAGYNTADLTLLKESSILLMIFLMLIGGSPGSTAGGLKTTTITVLFASVFAVFRRQPDVRLFKRKIEDKAIRSAAALVMLYVMLFTVSACLIASIEGLPLLTCMFETASAVGTVGLTLSVTPTLSLASRIIIILLMFIGRIGGLTAIYASIAPKELRSSVPTDKITIG